VIHQISSRNFFFVFLNGPKNPSEFWRAGVVGAG